MSGGPRDGNKFAFGHPANPVVSQSPEGCRARRGPCSAWASRGRGIKPCGLRAATQHSVLVGLEVCREPDQGQSVFPRFFANTFLSNFCRFWIEIRKSTYDDLTLWTYANSVLLSTLFEDVAMPFFGQRVGYLE